MSSWFALAFFTLLLWIGWWIYPTSFRVDPETNSLLSKWLFDAMTDWHTPIWVYHAVGSILVIAIALLLNHIHNRYKLSGTSNRLTAYFFVLFCALYPGFTFLSPTLLATFFLVLATQLLLRLYYEDAPRVWLFDIGFLVGIAVLLHVPTFFFFFWFAISIALLRPFRLGDFVALFLGLLVPLYLLGVYLFWIDQLPMLLELTKDLSPAYSVEFSFSYWDFAKGGLALAVWILFLFRNLSALFTYTIQVRKYLRVLIGFFPFALLAIMANRLLYLDHFLLLLVPMAVVYGFHYSDLAGKRWATALHALLFGLIILSQYLTFTP